MTKRIFLIPIFLLLALISRSYAQFNMPAFQAVQYIGSARVITSGITNVATTSANCGGIISGSLGNVVARGVCWSSLATTPTITNSRSYDGTALGSFSSNLVGLGSGTTYYARAYVTNDAGTTYYGSIQTFTTSDVYGYLNYSTYSSSPTANNVTQMNIATSGTVYSSGLLSASILINYSNQSTLTAAGVTTPNSGDDFALVASGWFIPTETGAYTFTCEGDDAVDLFINGTSITSQYGANGTASLGTHVGTRSLTAGVSYTFRARMKENSGQEALRVFWKKPSQAGGATWYQHLDELRPTSGGIPADTDGKIYYNGKLNYQMYSSGFNSPNSQLAFDIYINAATLSSVGTSSVRVITNFSSYNDLVADGITVPNGGDGFAIVATGFFVPAETGTYTFTCEGDDAIDLYINGVNIANEYGGHGASPLGTHTGTINLSAGVKYAFKGRMQENGGGEAFRVFWRKSSQFSGWYQDVAEISSQ